MNKNIHNPIPQIIISLEHVLLQQILGLQLNNHYPSTFSKAAPKWLLIH